MTCPRASASVSMPPSWRAVKRAAELPIWIRERAQSLPKTRLVTVRRERGASSPRSTIKSVDFGHRFLIATPHWSLPAGYSAVPKLLEKRIGPPERISFARTQPLPLLQQPKFRNPARCPHKNSAVGDHGCDELVAVAKMIAPIGSLVAVV